MVRKKEDSPKSYNIESTNLLQNMTNEIGIPEGFSNEISYEDMLPGIDEVTTQR